MDKKKIIGFIGQGFIGKNYADDFETRGYDVVRYDIDKYKQNKDQLTRADIIFIAVPTPTYDGKFDDSILKEALGIIDDGKIVVIKSTIALGVGRHMQKLFPKLIIMHSPEFLTERTAAYDAKNPERNIVGITDINDKKLCQQAEEIINILAKAPYNKITAMEEAELIKYGGNCWFYVKVVFMNMLYDLAASQSLNYDVIRDSLSADSRIGSSHLDVVHKGGRGAGGHCFLKDFEAFIEMLDTQGFTEQKKVCEKIRNMNLEYLKNSGKNEDLIEEIYGK